MNVFTLMGALSTRTLLDLQDLIRETIKERANKANVNCDEFFDVTANHSYLGRDYSKDEQILFTMLDNAAEFSDNRPTVTLFPIPNTVPVLLHLGGQHVAKAHALSVRKGDDGKDVHIYFE